MLNVPAQKIYYATRVGMLKAHRKGAAWVIHNDDVSEYREKFVNKKNNNISLVPYTGEYSGLAFRMKF